MKLSHAFMFLCLMSNVAAADYLRGTLIDNSDGSFDIYSRKGRFEVKATEDIRKSLPSLANPSFVYQTNGNPYSYEFKGTLDGDTFKLDQTPTNIPGVATVTGVLKYSVETGRYFLGDQEVDYGYTKNVGNYEFDEISKQSFVGKEVVAEGQFENGVLIIQAISPKDLFSATPAKRSVFDRELRKNPLRFIKKDIYRNKNSKSNNSFRATVYNEKGYSVSPGESAFLLTLSGRQGDSFGSVNGHFAAGLGEVKNDLSLRAEISNGYVTNGKDILSGNTSLNNYFSNIVQGQNNYRPTYTFIVYGINAEKLKKFRDHMEASHIKFRSEKLGISLRLNCTTETAKALVHAGIEGNHRRTLWNKVVDINNLGIPLRIGSLFGKAGDSLGYTASNDKEDFQPRPAFHSYIDSLTNKNVIKKLGIKRMDYVFYSQTPSNRPVGGAPSNHTFNLRVKHDSLFYKKLYDKYENEETREVELPEDEYLELLKVLDHVE